MQPKSNKLKLKIKLKFILKRKREGGRRRPYKTVALGSSSSLISDDDSFQNITKLLEIVSESVFLSFPRQTSDENLSVRRVAELVVDGCRRRDWCRCRSHWLVFGLRNGEGSGGKGGGKGGKVWEGGERKLGGKGIRKEKG